MVPSRQGVKRQWGYRKWQIYAVLSLVTYLESSQARRRKANSNFRLMMSANFKHKTTAASPGFLVSDSGAFLLLNDVSWHRDMYTNRKHVSDSHGWTRANVIWNWQKATLLTGVHLGPHFGEGEVVGGQRWYYSKEQRWFPIGSPLWPLHYL